MSTLQDLSGASVSGSAAAPKMLFDPPNPQESATMRFVQRMNKNRGLSLSSYHDLYEWSTQNIAHFWSEVWDEANIVGHKGSHVVDDCLPAANPSWFSEARLNWAENLLWCRSPSKIALVQAVEPTPDRPDPPFRSISYLELYNLVADLVSSLLYHGLKPGDRVASYSSNCIENVAACLAATAIGCIWVSAAADFAPSGVFERFEQVQPSIIFSVEDVVYNAKVHPHLPKLSTLLEELSKKSSLSPKVVVVETGHRPSGTAKAEWKSNWMTWNQFVGQGKAKKLGRTATGEIQWARRDFDWPLWILFSSGTTGRPKAIVHRAGGMLLQSVKEFAICADLRPDDVFFYYTTTGWMMWNFLVSGLSIGCTLVLYDGSPLRDPPFLFKLVDKLRITIFGISAKYIDQLSRVYQPRKHHDLSSLRHVYSTGSPLSPASFDFVYQHIHPSVLLGSITGGTDICSLFAGMCSALPVYRGEIQCRMLGMAIDSFDPSGVSCGPETSGELVCLRPFPCMPLGFWPLEGFGDPEAVEAAKTRYREAYFSQFEGIWYHGDHVIISHPKQGNGGGVVMLGRSDGVLNPGGVRFGSAELYDVVDLCFSESASAQEDHIIVDCLAVGQTLPDNDERVILFVKLRDGQMLSSTLEQRIKAEIRSRRSPRHVPAKFQQRYSPLTVRETLNSSHLTCFWKIVQVNEIPYTLNGKRVEVPVKKIINGAPISSVNPATLQNPGCLEVYRLIGEMLRRE